MIQPKNETEELLLSITKNCEKPFKQTRKEQQDGLEFHFNKSGKTFQFNPPITIEKSWMIGLTSLEVYNSISNITEHNNKFEIFTDVFIEFSVMEIKDELEEIFDIEHITAKHLQDEKTRPLNIKLFKKLRSEKPSTDAYLILLTNYASSPFRDSGSYLRFVVGQDEDDSQLIMKQYNSKFVTYGIPPGVYSVKVISEVVYTMGDHKGTLRVKYDNVSKKKKLILYHFVLITFNEITFLLLL